MITRSKSLTELYGEPTEAEINALIGDEQPDDQADNEDGDEEVKDVASIDAAVWTDAQRATTPGGGSLVTSVLVEFEDNGPQAAADLLGRHLDDVHVVTHPDSGLPHLEYRDRGSTITVAPATGDDDRIDYDQLGTSRTSLVRRTRPERR